MNWLMGFIFFANIALAEPYRILIISDENPKSVEKARDFKKYILTKPPYNKLEETEVEFVFESLPNTQLKCANSPNRERISECNLGEPLRLKGKKNAHFAMIFSSEISGAAGSEIPVSSTHLPNHVMAHEILHGYGCKDEYEFTSSEAELMCTAEFMGDAPNGAFFEDKPPYTSEDDARQRHYYNVPWMDSIAQNTPIAPGGSLGTPKSDKKKDKGRTGLFRGGACQKKIKSWRPNENSIMKNHYENDNIDPFYEDIIVKSMESSLGRKLKYKVTATKKAEEDCPPPGEVYPEVSDQTKLLKFLLK